MCYCSITTAPLLPTKAIYKCEMQAKWVAVVSALIVPLFFVPATHAASTTTRMGEDGGREEEVLYKCYISTFHSQEDQQEPCLSRADYCIGKFCSTQYPINTLSDKKLPVRRTCLNDTVGLEPGKCGTLSGELPGAADRVCLCIGHFCNGAVSSNSVLLSGFSATTCKLALGSSLLVSLLMHLL